MHYPVPHSLHTLPPDALRARAVKRRASVSANVAHLVAELAFGHLDRDRVTSIPVLMSEARS